MLTNENVAASALPIALMSDNVIFLSSEESATCTMAEKLKLEILFNRYPPLSGI